MRQNFGWALSNFSSAWFSEEKHFPVLLLFINELTSDVTKHPNNWAVSDLQYINKWWCFWKILQIFFQVYAKPNKEEKKKKRKRNLKEVSKVFFFLWGQGHTSLMQEDYSMWKDYCRQSVFLVLRKGQMLSEWAHWLPELAALSLFIYLLWMFFEQ